MSELRERKKSNGTVFGNEGNFSHHSSAQLKVAGFAGKMHARHKTCMCTVNAE